MGKVTTDILLTNQVDKATGSSTPRSMRLNNAIVDSGATMLSLSSSVIEALGLKQTRTSKVNVATGVVELPIFGVVELEIMGRQGAFEVMELRHPEIQALVGQIPLEMFDLLIHPGINRLIPNPFHDNQLILDQLITDEILSYPKAVSKP